MKIVFRSLFLALAVFLTGSLAQAQKIGHINLQELISVMPETKKVQDSLSSIQKQWEMILKESQSEIEKKYNEFSNNKTWTPQMRQFKQKELEDMSQKMDATRQQAQEDLQEKEQQLQEPIYEKAKKVINEVAKELGFTTVINSTGGYVLLVSNPGDDLMGPVKKKMGISESTPTPGKPAPKQ